VSEHTPREPDERDPVTPPEGDYALAPENPPAPASKERPLRSIGSLMEGIDEDAAADEKAARGVPTPAAPTISSYDPRTGRRRPKVLTDPTTDENRLRSDEGPVVAEGKLGWRAPAIIAATLFVVSIILAVVGAPKGEVWRLVGRELLHTPIDVALGVVALFVLARLAERPLGYWKGGVARVAAAVAAFHAVMNLDLDFGGALVLQWLAGALLYLGMLWAMTRAAVREVFVMGCVHFGLWAVVLFLFWLAPRLEPQPSAEQPVARPAGSVDTASPPARP